MNSNEPQISNNKIRQVIFLAVIAAFSGIILFNLSEFLPSLLGAVTLYIITRNFFLILVEKKRWKKWLAAVAIMLITLVIIILPMYFLIDVFIQKLGNAQQYVAGLNEFIGKIHSYIFSKTGIDLLSGENKEKLAASITKFSSNVLNATVNIITIIVATYFILFFMLTRAREMERSLRNFIPLKRGNMEIIGEKIRKMVIANAVGIPVVALAQAIVALFGYFIFGAPNAVLLFALTFVGAMIPIVGAAIIYVPVGIFMLASGETFGGIGIIIFGFAVVGLVDNIFRFTLLKKLENIHPLNTIFGIILGLKIFGFMGLIYGPILVSITFLLIKVYADEFGEPDNSEDETFPISN